MTTSAKSGRKSTVKRRKAPSPQKSQNLPRPDVYMDGKLYTGGVTIFGRKVR